MLNRNLGFSVVELLTAMVAGLVVLAGALSLFDSVLMAGNTSLLLSRLSQEVQGIGDMMSRDIQKAGYHPEAAADVALNRSASAAHYGFSMTEDLYTEPSATGLHCIRIKYWDASLPSDRRSVVRIYSHNRHTQQLKVHTTNKAVDTKSLSELCGKGSRLVSSDEIKVAELLFTLAPGSQTADVPSLNLTMKAYHVGRPDLTMSLQRHIYLRNQRGAP
ncbi:PilW family protein [Oceanisphaera sp.]|uniref:PilW family protein n=1 Tax=Oceanisphaera sp. TaxID=1929979 RepID=UPI003A91F5F3